MYINGTLLARGEIVVVDDQFGFRVTSVVAAG
jgi:flagellar motor switch/type III secretory pathway protein FliN